MIEQIKNETGTQQLLGYVLEIGHPDGGARCILDVTKAHLNRHNALHGGIMATVLDNAMGATASLTVSPNGRNPFLTISMTTQFMAPAYAGQRVTAVGRVTGGGRSTLFVAAELVDAEGGLIATSTGVFKKVRMAQGGDA